MNSEFFKALEDLENEKGIPKDYMLEKIEAAITAAIKKEYGSNARMRIVMDENKKELKVLRQKDVVAEVTDPEYEISVEDAKEINRRMAVGKVLETEVKTKEMRRLSAGAARSVIIQGIREAERKKAQEAYESKKEDIITATVSKFDSESGDIILETGTGYARLKAAEQIPGEVYRAGQKLKVYILEVNKEARGPLVTISRAHPGFLRCLLKLEVPEISDGTVLIKSVAREAGSRAKIAVYSNDETVDAVGACIGHNSARINAVLNELGGEKVDIVKYSESAEEFIAAALAPAQITSVEMIAERSAKVVVTSEMLSLAIGREGQNARLAAKLTGCKVDIKTE